MDCEQALSRLGAILVRVFAEGYGCPNPSTPLISPAIAIPSTPPLSPTTDFGFHDLAVSAGQRGEATVLSLLHDVFTVAHDAMMSMRSSASAPLVDWAAIVDKALKSALPSLAGTERAEAAGKAAAERAAAEFLRKMGGAANVN